MADEGRISLEQVADLAGVAHFRVDEERRIISWSAAAEALTGFSEQDVLGMPCVVGIRCEACLSGCGVQEHGQVRQVPLEIHQKTGGTLPVLMVPAQEIDLTMWQLDLAVGASYHW